MSDRTNAPLVALTEQRDRHRALVRQLAPLTAGLRGLVERRHELALTTQAVRDAEKAKATLDEWVKRGEARFDEASGWAELADAQGALEGAVDAFDRAGDPTADLDEPVVEEAPAGWVPTLPPYALASEAGMARYLAELKASSLEETMASFRSSLVEAAQLAQVVLAGSDGHQDVDGRPYCVVVEEHLGRALLVTTMVAEEVLDGLRRQAEGAEAGA